MTMLEKGKILNEMSEFRDRVTGRFIRKLTCAGEYNHVPTYHTNSAFTADNKNLVFTMARDGKSAIVSAELETGDIKVLAVTDGVGVDYMGDRSGGPYAPGSLGGGFSGNYICLAPASNWITAVVGKCFMAVHHDTLEERVFIRNIGAHIYGGPGCSPDGKKAVVTYAPEHPDAVAGKWPITRSYSRALREDYQGKAPTTYIQADFATGEVEEVWKDEFGCHHVQPSFADPNIWLIERLSNVGHGKDIKTHPRVWLLNIQSLELTPIIPNNAFLNISHNTWNRTGERIYYHGRAEEGGQYVGVSDMKGNILWEKVIPGAGVGHVSAHTQAEAVISDGLFSRDLIAAAYYEESAGVSGAPRIEILGAHDTDWQKMGWQYSHPHPEMSPDGRWVDYNRCERGRSDVCLLQVAE